MAPSSSILLQLPYEIFVLIILHLPNRDIKNLRLTCKTLCITSQLRVDCVFLLANPRNIKVFRSIAYHQVLRRQIVEIICDDARLQDCLLRRNNGPESPIYDRDYNSIDEVEDGNNYYHDGDGSDKDDNDDIEDNKYSMWFVNRCQDNIEHMTGLKGLDVDRPDHVARAERVSRISLKASWRYYQHLLRQ